MDASSLVSQLDRVVPGFRIYAASDQNLFGQDSLSGVFAACSTFVRGRSMSERSWQDLAELLNETVRSPDEELAEAACTCFLESLTDHGHPLAPHLKGEALAYWRRWCDDG